jgi:D-cysteine desulfhydrase
VNPAELPLFRRFPAARGRLPHQPFLSGPTPVAPLPLLPGPAAERLFVKRDERCCPLYGGNKPRKLEFVIGRARERGARRLVTTGGLGTHHGLATTILGREAGLATTLVLVNQPLTDEVRESLRLFAAFGAEVVYGRHLAGAALGVIAALGRAQWRGERPMLVPTGGSSALGNLGLVSAGLELAEQVRAGIVPEPAEIYLPVGSGGTCAGLLVGLRLAGLASRLVPVLVTDILPPSPRRLVRAAAATLSLLRRADPSVPRVAVGRDDFPLVRRQVGAGYGAPTPAAREACQTARQAGLAVEMTYTSKCLAELLARAREGTLAGGPVLFWNTWSAVDVRAAAPHPLDGAGLPPSLARLATPEPSAGEAA